MIPGPDIHPFVAFNTSLAFVLYRDPGPGPYPCHVRCGQELGGVVEEVDVVELNSSRRPMTSTVVDQEAGFRNQRERYPPSVRTIQTGGVASAVCGARPTLCDFLSWEPETNEALLHY